MKTCFDRHRIVWNCFNTYCCVFIHLLWRKRVAWNTFKWIGYRCIAADVMRAWDREQQMVHCLLLAGSIRVWHEKIILCVQFRLRIVKKVHPRKIDRKCMQWRNDLLKRFLTCHHTSVSTFSSKAHGKCWTGWVIFYIVILAINVQRHKKSLVADIYTRVYMAPPKAHISMLSSFPYMFYLEVTPSRIYVCMLYRLQINGCQFVSLEICMSCIAVLSWDFFTKLLTTDMVIQGWQSQIDAP